MTAPTIPLPHDAATTRVWDGNGREWARKTNGSWGCLGHAITADNLADLDARYVLVAGSTAA